MPDEFPVWIWPVIGRAQFSASGTVKGSSEDEDEEEKQQYVNYYRCPFDGTKWADVWSCCCNDRCPKCGAKDIEPYKSEDVVHTQIVTRKRTNKLKRRLARNRPRR
jgi:hypothetical protein